MPYYAKRRRPRRRPRKGRGRRPRRYAARSRVMRNAFTTNANRGIYYFRRNLHSDLSYTVPALSNESNCQIFNIGLNSVPNYTEFTNLFDQYKILKIKCRVRYNAGNSDDIANVSQIQFPVMYGVPDADDTGLITFSQMQEHGKMFRKPYGDHGRMDQQLTVPIYVQDPVTELAGVYTGRNPIWSPWIDTSNAAIRFGALKTLVHGSPATTYTFSVDWQIVFACRNTR